MLQVVRSLPGLLVLFAATVAFAEIKIEPARVDLGRQKQGLQVTAAVRLTNTGIQAVDLLGTSADCGCTVATFKVGTLAPGESTSLQIAVETRDYQGALRRTVRLQTSLGELSVPVDMNVVPYEYWALTPRAVVMLPREAGKPSRASAKLSYSGQRNVEITRITCSPAWVNAEASALDAKTFALTLTQRADAPVGSHSIKVTVESTASQESEFQFGIFLQNGSAPVIIPKGTGASHPSPVPLRVVPTTVILPTRVVGQPTSREIVLQGWTREGDPRITLPHGEARLISREAGELKYEVSMTPTRPGPINTVLRVFDGERLLLEAVVLARAEAPRAGTAQ